MAYFFVLSIRVIHLLPYKSLTPGPLGGSSLWFVSGLLFLSLELLAPELSDDDEDDLFNPSDFPVSFPSEFLTAVVSVLGTLNLKMCACQAFRSWFGTKSDMELSNPGHSCPFCPLAVGPGRQAYV